MKYMLRIVNLPRSDVRILVIDFEQPRYIALSDFFSDVNQFGGYIQNNFMQVLSHQVENICFFCNLCTVNISPSTTTIISNYALEAGNETDRCDVSTAAIAEFVDWWCLVRNKWMLTGILPVELNTWYEWHDLESTGESGHGTGDGSLSQNENSN